MLEQIIFLLLLLKQYNFAGQNIPTTNANEQEDYKDNHGRDL